MAWERSLSSGSLWPPRGPGRADFDCAPSRLNRWLQQRSMANNRSGATRSFVVCDVALAAASSGACGGLSAGCFCQQQHQSPVADRRGAKSQRAVERSCLLVDRMHQQCPGPDGDDPRPAGPALQRARDQACCAAALRAPPPARSLLPTNRRRRSRCSPPLNRPQRCATHPGAHWPGPAAIATGSARRCRSQSPQADVARPGAQVEACQGSGIKSSRSMLA